VYMALPVPSDEHPLASNSSMKSIDKPPVTAPAVAYEKPRQAYVPL
jgi:hypothetical protein